MPFNLGIGELVTVLAALVVTWGIPIAAALWAIRTLAGLRHGQRATLARLDALDAAAPRQALARIAERGAAADQPRGT